MPTAIEVVGLRKTYGDLVAVNDISFEVNEGEIFGMVGPNGAGKTTTIECIEGLRQPEAGKVHLLGEDPFKERTAIAERIGIQLQESAIPARLRVGEAMSLFSSFYSRRADADELLELLGLTEKRSTAYAKLSGGQNQAVWLVWA